MLKLYHGTNLNSTFNICVHGVDLSKSLAKLSNDIENGICDISNIDYSQIIPYNEEHYGNQYSFHTN